MPVNVSYIRNEDRLDLILKGNVDVTISQDICDVCRQLPAELRVCIIDLSDVECLFDSGVALLQMLHGRLVERGVMVVFLSDRADIRSRLAGISRRQSEPARSGCQPEQSRSRSVTAEGRVAACHPGVAPCP